MMLDITRHELSDLINKRFGGNFYALLNRHRIQEAVRILTQAPESKVIDVDMSVGFSSKSTFNKEFRRITGRTHQALKWQK